MDPLSIIASSISVLGAAGAILQVVQKIVELRHLPDILLASINEVSDLTLIVQEVKSVFQLHQSSSNFARGSVSTIYHVLDRAAETLIELDKIINERLLLPSDSHGRRKINRSAWLRKRHCVHKLQERLRTVKQDLTVGLTALNLYVNRVFHRRGYTKYL